MPSYSISATGICNYIKGWALWGQRGTMAYPCMSPVVLCLGPSRHFGKFLLSERIWFLMSLQFIANFMQQRRRRQGQSKHSERKRNEKAWPKQNMLSWYQKLESTATLILKRSTFILRVCSAFLVPYQISFHWYHGNNSYHQEKAELCAASYIKEVRKL